MTVPFRHASVLQLMLGLLNHLPVASRRVLLQDLTALVLRCVPFGRDGVVVARDRAAANGAT